MPLKPPTKALRLPWREAVTLCVAAESKLGRKPCFVFAKNFEVETDIARAEIGIKWTVIGKSEFPALIAGSPDRALELAGLIQDKLESPIHNETLVDVARNAVKDFKYKLANELISGRFGISYDKLLAGGETLLPPEARRDIFDDIARLTIGCYLLWLVWDNANNTIIIKVNENATVDGLSHFGAIGSGAYIAESALYQREQNDTYSLGRTIYHIFEAMKLGSKAPGVGEKFSLHIATLHDDVVHWKYMDDDYHKYLEGLFKKFGPKKATGVQYKPDHVKLEYPKPSTSQTSEQEQ